MFLFTRTLGLRGSPRRTVPWVMSITDLARERSGLEVAAWATEFGGPLGSVTWSALVESQAELAAATAPLRADAEYLDLLEEGMELAPAPAEDALLSLLHGTPADAPPVGAIASVTRATITMARAHDAMAWSVEMAQHVEKVTGDAATCWSSAFGPMGEITWISVVDSPAAADAAMSALGTDEGYVERLHETGELFVPGSGHVARLVRIH